MCTYIYRHIALYPVTEALASHVVNVVCNPAEAMRDEQEADAGEENSQEADESSDDGWGGAASTSVKASRAKPVRALGSVGALALSAKKKAAAKRKAKKNKSDEDLSGGEEGESTLDPEMSRVNKQLGGTATRCLVNLSVGRTLNGEKLGVARQKACQGGHVEGRRRRRRSRQHNTWGSGQGPFQRKKLANKRTRAVASCFFPCFRPRKAS